MYWLFAMPNTRQYHIKEKLQKFLFWLEEYKPDLQMQGLL
jgi:hypothetical protein